MFFKDPLVLASYCYPTCLENFPLPTSLFSSRVCTILRGLLQISSMVHRFKIQIMSFQPIRRFLDFEGWKKGDFREANICASTYRSTYIFASSTLSNLAYYRKNR